MGRTRLGLLLAVGIGCGCGTGADSVDTASQASQGSGGESVPTPNWGCGSDGECGVKPPVPPPWRDDADCDRPSIDAGSDVSTDPPVAPVCGFTPYNDGLVGGQISDVAYDKRAGVGGGVAWAAAGGRLFKSTDSGATWTMVFEGTAFGFRKLALPPGDPKVLMAASSSGIVRSEDAGLTWTIIALDGLSISTMLVHPAEPLRVYAGVFGAGLIRSNDGGLTWSSIDNGVPYGEVTALVADPSNVDTFMASMLEYDTTGAHTGGVVLRTVNGGKSWARVQDNAKSLMYELEVCPANPDIVYASAANYYGGVSGVLRSNDRGLTWSTTAGLAGKLVTTVAVAPTDCDTVYAVHYDLGLKRSTDGGTTFSAPLTSGIPFVNKFPRHVSVDPASTTRLIGASHAGVLFSQNGGDTFSVVGGVMNLAIRSLGVSPMAPDQLWMATWGSGLWTRPSAGTSWAKNAMNVDYTFAIHPDPTVASRVFAGTWSYPFMSTDDGASFSSIDAPHNPTAFAFDPSSTSTVYMATQIKGLFKSTDSGTTWTSSNGALTAWDVGGNVFTDMRAVVVDKNAASRVLVGTNGRGIYRSEDGAATLSPVAPSLSNALVTCLVQTADGAFYACVNGGGIAKSTDQGATFSAVNTGLPSLNVAAVVADGNTLYSTSNLGVFRSIDGAASWTSIDTACLPPGGGGQVAIVGTAPSKKLVVATGRGVFAHAL